MNQEDGSVHELELITEGADGIGVESDAGQTLVRLTVPGRGFAGAAPRHRSRGASPARARLPPSSPRPPVSCARLLPSAAPFHVSAVAASRAASQARRRHAATTPGPAAPFLSL